MIQVPGSIHGPGFNIMFSESCVTCRSFKYFIKVLVVFMNDPGSWVYSRAGIAVAARKQPMKLYT